MTTRRPKLALAALVAALFFERELLFTQCDYLGRDLMLVEGFQ